MEYTDRRRHAKESQIKAGDRVLVNNVEIPSFLPNSVPDVVISRKGTKVTTESANKHQMTRSASHFKRFVYKPDAEDDYEEDSQKRIQDRNNADHEEPGQEDQTQNQRNRRLRRVPDKYCNPVPLAIIRKTTFQKGE